jgi:hypothetical protein
VMSIVVPRIRYLLIQFIMPLKRTSLQGSATFGRCHDLKATVCVNRIRIHSNLTTLPHAMAYKGALTTASSC